MIRSCVLLVAAVGLNCVLPARAATAGPSGYAVTDSIRIGGDGFWDCLTIDASAHRLYLSHSSHVQVVDLDRGTVVGDIPNTPGVHGIALVPETGEGYTSNGRDSTVTVFDLKTLKAVATIHVPGANPDIILYDPWSERVFTMNGRSNDATAIDVHTHRPIGSVDLGGKPEFAVSDSSGKVFVNLEDRSELVVFDSRSLQVLRRWPLAPGEEPTGLAIDREHHRLFSACHNQRLVVLDADSGSVVATLPIGPGVDGAAYDPATGLVFTPNGGDGTLTVIREESPDEFTVVENVPTEPGARTLALDPLTHRIYLPTASFGPRPERTEENPHPRPTILPGSFRVLVVSR